MKSYIPSVYWKTTPPPVLIIENNCTKPNNAPIPTDIVAQLDSLANDLCWYDCIRVVANNNTPTAIIATLTDW